MRQFVCLGHDVPTTSSFSLDDLAGGAGRLDVLCRAITAAFVRSHDIRSDVRVNLVCQDELTIVFDGSVLRRLNPDERSTAALVRKALDARDEAIGSLPAEPSPGIEVYRRGFAETIDACEASGPIIQLHEDGEPAVDAAVPTDPVFVLSDHHDFTADEQALLDENGDRTIRLGPTALHADQAITIAHHFLDTDGYREF